MNKEYEQQIVDYYSVTDKYTRSNQYSNAHQTVFTKEHDKYQWLVLEQKGQSQVEVRLTDRHGKITAWDNYELTKNRPICVSMKRLCRNGNMRINFNADEINIINKFGEKGKAETCANLTAILPHIRDSNIRRTVSTTLKKLNILSEESCTELTATTKGRKMSENAHSIKARLARAKEQIKEPTVAEGKQHRIGRKVKEGIEL